MSSSEVLNGDQLARPAAAGTGDSYEVYVNGVRQEPGRDFDRIGDELVFRRALAQEGRLGPVRWLSMLLGVAGTYRSTDRRPRLRRGRAPDGGLAHSFVTGSSR